MRRSKSLRAAASIVSASLLVGCGSEFPVAPVAGTVTLGGAPLANAVVFFQPQRRGDALAVGPPSQGVTDPAGRFELHTIQGDSGAVVGDHIVSVSTFESRLVDPANSDRIEVLSEERVPPRYRNPSELRFTVPSSGSSEADFALEPK